MPKMKTHKGTKKRVKVTGSGKVSVKHSGKSHILKIGRASCRERV